MMKTPDATDLLHVWESGVGQSPAMRACLLMTTVLPEHERSTLTQWTIGQRDRLLLDLRNALFGPEVQCLTACVGCGESIELDFHLDDIRVPHGKPGHPYHAAAESFEVQFRLPDISDLLALEGRGPEHAERQLLSRCVLKARTKGGDVELDELPPAVMSAVNQGMSEADPQAEIVLKVSCPACSDVSPAPFDIVAHLWAELEEWAKRLFREVHALADAYGWSEGDILRMSPVRRRTYLDLIGC